MPDEDDLEAFIEESLRRSGAKNYHPAVFIRMRDRWGTKEAMTRLMVSGDLQSGFRRLQELGLLEWSIEAGILRFPSLFPKSVRDAAQFRIDQVKRADKASKH